MNENSEDAEAEFPEEFQLKCNISVKMLQILQTLNWSCQISSSTG
jgi:hypothetical protein